MKHDLLIVALNSQVLPTHANNSMNSGDIVALLLVNMARSLVGVVVAPQGQVNTVVLWSMGYAQLLQYQVSLLFSSRERYFLDNKTSHSHHDLAKAMD